MGRENDVSNIEMRQVRGGEKKREGANVGTTKEIPVVTGRQETNV